MIVSQNSLCLAANNLNTKIVFIGHFKLSKYINSEWLVTVSCEVLLSRMNSSCVLIENFGLKEIGYELDLTVSS